MSCGIMSNYGEVAQWAEPSVKRQMAMEYCGVRRHPIEISYTAAECIIETLGAEPREGGT